MGDARLVVDADAGVRYYDSLTESRALFGRDQAYFYKVQAGVVVWAQKPEWVVSVSPTFASFTTRIFGYIDVAQSLEFSPPPSVGFTRKLKLRNAGDASIRLRIMGLSDPTFAHFRDSNAPWGSLGLNAFNRESHIVIDEISEPHPARVVGSIPAPARFYMTTSRVRASELLLAGDLSESTAGMSGQVLVLALHEFDLVPGETKEILGVSLYSPSRLEDVLSEFRNLESPQRISQKAEPMFFCSSTRLSEAFSWAAASLEGAQFEKELLDRMELFVGSGYVRPDSPKLIFDATRGLVDRAGFVPHSLAGSRPGILETTLFLTGVSTDLILRSDKKAARAYYPILRRMGIAIAEHAKGGILQLDSDLPQGWRRRIGRGYPSGEVPEVSLAASKALLELSRLSRLIGKGEDAAQFREKSELILDSVGKRLIDERGFLGLSFDPSGRLRTDETLDMVVSCYRNPALRSAASSGVHRMLEKDFETEYGPRTVPTSNWMYFNSAYGEGQLGGYWTRGAMAFICLAYAAGLPGIGSLSLEKASKLVTEESLKLWGAPGEFPYWVDIEGKRSHGERSDPVAGARFVQAVVEGEFGFSASGSGAPTFSPPQTSSLKWAMAIDLWVGEKISIFVGRSGNKAFVFGACQRASIPEGQKFAKSERVEILTRGVHGISFHGPGQIVCVGNSTQAPLRTRITFSGRSAGLAKRLSTNVEEFNPKGESWNKTGNLRVSPTMTFDAQIPSGDWKVFRVSEE